ncbi:hypothetical protein GCM10009579_31440 [Streptomyces javensis]|uniref:Uncharacterized protein n=3 Tax=Streptomyces violaceusniger group TaxID=2839105 RepID=A0ABN1PM63_9ACTN
MRVLRLAPVLNRPRTARGEGRMPACRGIWLSAIDTECVTGLTDNGLKASCTPAGK